jgi:hypothetical protein
LLVLSAITPCGDTDLTNIINLTNSGEELVDGDRVRIEHPSGATEEFYFRAIEEPDPPTFLYMTFPTRVTVGDTINMTAAVKFENGDLVPVNTTYDVPVIRDSDNLQIEYLTVEFSGGEAAFSFVANDTGKMIMVTSKIDPKPTSVIVNFPEIKVVNA